MYLLCWLLACPPLHPKGEQLRYVPSMASASNRAMFFAWCPSGAGAGGRVPGSPASVRAASRNPVAFPPCQPQGSSYSALAVGFRKEFVSLGLGFCCCCCCVFKEACSLFGKVFNHVRSCLDFSVGQHASGIYFPAVCRWWGRKRNTPVSKNPNTTWKQAPSQAFSFSFPSRRGTLAPSPPWWPPGIPSWPPGILSPAPASHVGTATRTG